MKPKIFARNLLCSAIILVQSLAFPSLAIAQEAAPEINSAPTSSATTTTTEEKPRNPAPAPQTKKDTAYKDNGDGTWSNGDYTWNSATKQTKPNKPQDYSYNPGTGQWDTKDWAYNTQTEKYEPNKPVVKVEDSTKKSAPNTANPSNQSLSVKSTESDSDGTFDLFFDGSISNSFSSEATSGDALVHGNTKAGDALTGDALTIATLLNLLQSSWGDDSQIATFINNIDGNVYGDLVIDPAKLLPNLSVGNSSDVDVNIASSGVINNDINLVATSGNATVDSNTEAGDAETGTATAMANVINMINSAIKAGQSFLGMININGTFDGDILLPKGILEALIASTGAPPLGGMVDSTTNRTINNDVQTAAASGDAVIDNNTTAGNATSGNAQTAINTMNLVGQNLVGNNALLVFVNVLGKWVGLVVGPSGTTLAQPGPSSMNTVDAGGNQSVSVSATENSLINNRISVAAQSGSARVTNNTTAGDATSGDARATVNLLNIIGSNINVADWFGVLFINVFGNWFGSFGVDTSNGGFSQTPPPSTPNTGGVGGNQATPVTPAVASGNTKSSNRASSSLSRDGQVFAFVARGGTTSRPSASSQPVAGEVIPTLTPFSPPEQFIFGASPGSVKDNNEQVASGASASSDINWWLIFGIVGMIATLVILGREYVLAIREEQRLA